MTAPLPRDLEESLPLDLDAGAIAAWARIARSFDRVHGEALVLRMRDGTLLLLTRPESLELFRALPLAPHDPMRVSIEGGDARLAVRVVDGRALRLPLLEEELSALRSVLSGAASGSTSRPPSRPPSRPLPGRPSSAPPRAASSAPPSSRLPLPSRTPSSSTPPSHGISVRTRGTERSSTIRPPESAEFEVVRIPRAMRSAVGLPSDVTRGPASRPELRPATRHTPPEIDKKSDSVRPPAFASEPAPLVRSARDIDALRASFRHHFDQGALDEAGQVARALVHLGIADGLERRLATFQPESPPSFATPLTSYLFRAFLAHDEEDLDLGRALAAIWPAYLQLRARPDRELGLRPRDEISLTTATEGLGRLFAHGARAFSLQMPRLFLRTDVPGGMAHLQATPRASLCGGTLATAFDAASTLHVLGHHLSLYREEAYLIALAPSPIDLYALLMAGLHLEGRVPSEDPRIVTLAETLAKHMAPPVREALRLACGDLPLPGDDPGAAALEALRRHRRAVMLTAVRAGFALSGSLAISDRMQRVMPVVPGVALDDMLDDLVTYSVSPSWAALRKELGIAVEPSGVSPPIGQRT